MIEAFDPNAEKPLARCENCDRETNKYIVNLSPDNVEQVLCWICKERGEKGLNTKRGFHRGARGGDIPR
jgi:hypothetical protein